MRRRLTVSSPKELSALDLIARAIWVFDVERHEIWWGNEAAVDLWECDNLDELVSKDFSTDSETVRQRLRLKVAELSEREYLEEQWTLYPGGIPKQLHVRFTSLRIGTDARQALLIEDLDVTDGTRQPEEIRLMEAARYAPVLISYFAITGEPIFRNPTAAEAYGQPERQDQGTNDQAEELLFSDQFADPTVGRNMLACCVRQQVCREDHKVLTARGVRQHAIDARLVRDPATGEQAVLVIEEDVTDRESALENLSASQTHLTEAISAMPDGFVYYDADDRVVIYNQRYVDMYPALAEEIAPGRTFEELLRFSVSRGDIPEAEEDPATWIWDRVQSHKEPKGTFEQLLQDGRIIEVIEYKTADGGIVGIRRDITAFREAERALAESRALLVDAVESLGDAFILTDTEDRIVLTNARYREYYAEIEDLIEPGTRFSDMLLESAKRGLYPAAVGRVDEWVEDRLAMREQTNVAFEQPLNDGRWLRILERRTSNGGIAGSRVDITEIKEAQKVAEEASRAKSEFLSSMSHELRTPLNSILGFAQVLDFDLRETATPKQRRAIEMINLSGQHLLTLITDVLDLARIEAGRMELTMASVDVAEVLDDCLAVLEAMARPRQIEILPEFDRNTAARVHADAFRLKQVLLNILSNAVKYNVQGGKIWLTTACIDDSRLRISIRDTGAGIAPEKAEAVFSPFDRLGRESLDIEGSGVGLVISKNLIELMGGEIGFESETDNGSTFWVEIPLFGVETGENHSN